MLLVGGVLLNSLRQRLDPSIERERYVKPILFRSLPCRILEE
jgi:hypothetical protein